MKQARKLKGTSCLHGSVWSKGTEGCWAGNRPRPEAGCSALGFKGALSLQSRELRTGRKKPNPRLNTSGALLAPAGTAKCPPCPAARGTGGRLSVTILLSEILQGVLASYGNRQQNIPGMRTNYKGNRSWDQTSHASVLPHLLLALSTSQYSEQELS